MAAREDAPPDRVISLPVPPSTNALWSHPGLSYGRRSRVRSLEYRKWIAEAGWHVRRQMVCVPMLHCTFDAEVRVPLSSHRDRDNWTKPLMDLLQTMGVVLNDSGLRDYAVRGEDRADVLVLLWDRGGQRQRQAARPHQPTQGRPARAKPSTVALWRSKGVLV